MGEVIPFAFERHAVRVAVVDGQPWFVAKDVCRVLGHSNSRVALTRLDDDEKGVTKVYTLGGHQTLGVVSESGLYALILTSTKPSARRFRRWVTSEVLPTLLREGHYSADPADAARLAERRAFAAGAPEEHRAVAEARAAAVARVEALVGEGWPRVMAVKAVTAETGMAERTLWAHRSRVWMVPRRDHAAALTPRWSQKRGLTAPCHPEALRLFLDLRGSGLPVTRAYLRTIEVAGRNGWSPIPCERTLRRAARCLLPAPLPRPPGSKEAA